MDDASHVFRRMDAQELVDLERATGLLVNDEEAWSLEDYDNVIAYLRRKAGMRTSLIRDRRSPPGSALGTAPETMKLPAEPCPW